MTSLLTGKERELVEEAHDQSIELLRRNATPRGIVASPEEREDNYHAVWGRDGSICALAAVLVEDEPVREAGIQTLLTLADHQASNGQIPSYLRLDEENRIQKVVYGGLGNVTTVDSNLWFLIAARTALHHCQRKEFLEDRLFEVYRRTLRHLESLDSDCCGLLEIPIAGDWSDILDRSYHILYDQVLWYQAVQRTARLHWEKQDDQAREKLQRRSHRIREEINRRFWWDRETMERMRSSYLIQNPLPTSEEFLYYQSHLQPFCNYWHRRFDVFGNVLAGLMGVAPRNRCDVIIQHVLERRLDLPYPVRVLDPPIESEDKDWFAIYETKEQPYEYHNGGIWPLAGGFWVMLLALRDRPEAVNALVRLAESLRACRPETPAWAFQEYFHGQTGQPMGHPHQSWNAAAYILAYQTVVERRKLIFAQPRED